MKIKLLEKPSIYFRGENAIVIFPSIPYWFSATQEIRAILEAFCGDDKEEIILGISNSLGISRPEAASVFNDVSDMLYVSGALEINGEKLAMRSYSPHFQINEVENVLVIATTLFCNLSCPMCYAVSSSRKTMTEMSTKDITSIVDQVCDMPWENRVSRIALTGGELFSRSDAMGLIKYVHSKGLFVQVNTNATLLSKRTIKMLAKLPKVKLSVSLDGCQSKSHEFIRGKGTFDRAIDTIRRLCKHGVDVAVNMFVHTGNIMEIKETLLLAQSLGVKAFNCLNMMHVGRGNTKRTKQVLSAVPLDEFYRQVYLAIKDDESLKKMMQNSTFSNQIMGIAAGVKSNTCGIGTNRAMYVKPDGSIYPCADTALSKFKLGNLLRDNLSNIWRNSCILTELRALNIDTMNTKCKACDVRYICAGSCRGENYQTTHDLRSPHFKCDEIHDSILELMWILTEDPDLFKDKIEDLHRSVNNHAASA